MARKSKAFLHDNKLLNSERYGSTYDLYEEAKQFKKPFILRASTPLSEYSNDSLPSPRGAESTQILLPNYNLSEKQALTLKLTKSIDEKQKQSFKVLKHKIKNKFLTA